MYAVVARTRLGDQTVKTGRKFVGVRCEIVDGVEVTNTMDLVSPSGLMLSESGGQLLDHLATSYQHQQERRR